MVGDWHEVPLGELVEIFDGPHATPPKTGAGPVFLGISNLARGRVDLANSEHLSEDDFNRWTRRVEPKPGDVVFSYETLLGEAAFIPLGLRCCLGRRLGLLRARPGRVDSRFLLYAYLGPQFQETLRSRTVHGSTVDRIPLIGMSEFPIKVSESIDEQRAIAHVLGTLDDKIELNRRMSETLETMARALFKSWFVDFDPVRAKCRGEPVCSPQFGQVPHSGQAHRPAPTKWPQHILDLFPDRFVDSELGEIPEGWEVKSIDNLCMLRRDGLNPGGYPDEMFDHYSIPAYDEGCVPKPEAGVTIKSNKHVVPADSVLLSKLNPRIPRVWRPVPSVGRRSVCSTEFLVAVPKPGCTADFLYCLFISCSFSIEFSALITGTSGSHQRVRPQAFLKILIVCPPAHVIEGFTSLVCGLIARIDEARNECGILAALRDTLLPKLLSGEIALPAAEALAEDVS